MASHALFHPALIALQVLIASSVFAMAAPGVETIGAKAVRLFLTVSLGRDLFYAARKDGPDGETPYFNDVESTVPGTNTISPSWLRKIRLEASNP